MKPQSQETSDDTGGEDNKGPTQVRWTAVMDRLLLETLVKQLSLGNKEDNGWKPIAFALARKSLWKALDITISNDHIKNRLKTWKFYCDTVDKCLKHGGFRWNEEANMLEATNSVWSSYLKKNPKAAVCRRKNIDNFKDICRIMGKDQLIDTLRRNLYCEKAGGSQIGGGFEDLAIAPNLGTHSGNHRKPTSKSYKKRKRDGESENGAVGTGSPSFGHQSTQPTSKSSLPTQKEVPPKRTRDGNSEVEMVNIMGSLASGIKRIASAMEDKKPVDLSTIVQELSKIPDFSDELIVEASEFLASDDKWGRLFLAFSGDMRRSWLLKHLGH